MTCSGEGSTITTVCPPQPSADASPTPLRGGAGDTLSSELWPAGRVLVVAATYNEIDNIAALTEAVGRELDTLTAEQLTEVTRYAVEVDSDD